jgi:hypothetical protein
MIKLCDLRWRKRRAPSDILVGRVGGFWLMLVPRSGPAVGKEDSAYDIPYATLFVSTDKTIRGGGHTVMTPLRSDHCSGCGEPGRLVDEPIFDRGQITWNVLTVVAASNFPDGRKRYLCPRCMPKFLRQVKRLARAKTGWGHLT